MEKIILTTPDIFCEHCVETTQNAARALPGVLAAVTDLDSKQVTVVYEPSQVSLDQIEAALDEEGYPVSERMPASV
jgi:copper chaperone